MPQILLQQQYLIIATGTTKQRAPNLETRVPSSHTHRESQVKTNSHMGTQEGIISTKRAEADLAADDYKAIGKMCK